MRRLAWVLVVGGVFIASAYPFYASRESDRLVDRWYNESVASNNLAQVQATVAMLRRGRVPAWTQLSPWPGVIAGVALAGVGGLILAIRRPQS